MKSVSLIITLVTCLLASVDAFSARCRHERSYGVAEQAMANCYVLGGEPRNCTVLNWDTRYQVCQCDIGCETDDRGCRYDDNGRNNDRSCRTESVYGVREQANGNCAALGGTVKSCTIMNWQTGYQVCKCEICR